MPIPYSSTQFTRLLKGLADDIVFAHIHWRLAQDLDSSLSEHPLVEAQSNTFWYLTLRAHKSTALQHLCKAFDQEQKSLHLLSWLNTIKANISLFDTDAFRERLKDNSYVQSLSESAIKPDPALLETDIALCTGTDRLVRSLVVYRSNSAAHRSKKLTLQHETQTSSASLTYEEIESLLTRSITILNRYSYMFKAETYSTSIIGKNDYQYIFKTVEASVL